MQILIAVFSVMMWDYLRWFYLNVLMTGWGLVFLLVTLVGAFAGIRTRERAFKKMYELFNDMQRQDFITKKAFIFSKAEPVLEGFNVIVLKHQWSRKKIKALVIIRETKELLQNNVEIMSRDRIFEEIDKIIAFLDDNVLDTCQMGQDGREVFLFGCEILRELKRIPLEKYRGEYSFYEIIEKVSRKLPEFEMAIIGILEEEKRSDDAN